jgi:hypothetical protein
MTCRCRVCGGAQTEVVADLGKVPVLTGVLADQAATARAMAQGRMELSVCRRCGHVANAAFDPTLVEYDGSYDNSLYFSGIFQQYADRLVARLVERHDLHHRVVLEIGAGSGEFLTALCSAGHNKGLGFDPSSPATEAAPGVELVQDYFRPHEHHPRFDLLVCRHVLEHLDDPFTFLHDVVASAPADAVFYLEVPSAEYNFGSRGLWDCIYPHVSYFSSGSLHALVTRAGLDVLDEGRSFGGQFLYVEACPSASRPSIEIGSAAEHVAVVRGFEERWTQAVSRWDKQIAHADRPVVLWGAGAKGATFAHAVDPFARLGVVDLNSRKWGRFLPCTGHEVLAPESLTAREVDSVLVTNAIYRDEIRRQLDDLGVRTALITV